MIGRFFANEAGRCDYCADRLTVGQHVWRDDSAGVTGCCHACCKRAVDLRADVGKRRRLVHGMSHLHLSTGE